MQKQLSKKSHKPTQSSIDDFMKHIRKYNLQSQRYISPKPLLYMYTNPSRHYTLQTLQKSRSKSKTLSNRQGSHSKKGTSKNIRQKVQKMLSLQKRQKMHKKSISLISNKNQKSNKKLNKSNAIIDLTKSKQKLKSKIRPFKEDKQKDTIVKDNKGKKSKTKFQQFRPKFTERSPIRAAQLSSQIENIDLNEENPAELIQIYSNKLMNAQKYLQSNKNKLGSMLCRKFQQILNQIVQSLVQNLKKTLNQLQKDIQNRLSTKFQKQFDKSMLQKQKQIKDMQKICQKITKKFSQSFNKNNYLTTLIYSLRLKGIDIDNQFGKALWGVDDVGGNGYRDVQELSLEQQQTIQNQICHNQVNYQEKQHQNLVGRDEMNSLSSQGQFQFRQHPNKKRKQTQNFFMKNKEQSYEEEINNRKYLHQNQRLKTQNQQNQQMNERNSQQHENRIKQFKNKKLEPICFK